MIFAILFFIYCASSVRINEVAPYESNNTTTSGDWIELYIPPGPLIDLKGWYIKATFENAEKTLYITTQTVEVSTSNAYLVVYFASMSVFNSGWNLLGFPPTGYVLLRPNTFFYEIWFDSTSVGTTAGLVGTDNVLILYDSNNTVIDAFVYADYDDSFTGTEGRNTRYIEAVSAGQWSGPSINHPFSMELLASGNSTKPGSFVRYPNGSDSDNSIISKNEWFRVTSANMTRGGANTRTPTDTTPPGNITDLAIGNVSETIVNLTFTTPGDDGFTGLASRYVIKYATYSLTTATDYYNAVLYFTSAATKTGGNLEMVSVSGLTPNTTYWFIVGVEDRDTGETSLLSTSTLFVSTLTMQDTIPPDPVTDLVVSEWYTYAGSVKLEWTAPADKPDDLPVSSYILKYATYPGSDETWWNNAYGLNFSITPKSPGLKEVLILTGFPSNSNVYFRIRSKDGAGNISQIDSSTQSSVGVYVSSHILISEVCASLLAANTEYVELYNPLDIPVSVTDYFGLGPLKIRARNVSGAESLIADLATATTQQIKPRGFYLITNSTDSVMGVMSDFVGSWTSGDFTSTATVYIGYGTTGFPDKMIDKVTFGEDITVFTDPYVKEPIAGFLGNNDSIHRKPSYSLGHSSDTNSSFDDFIKFSGTQNMTPKNSLSPPDPNTPPPAPVVDSPNGGEVLQATTSFVIKWSSSPDVDGENVYFEINYSTDNGSSWIFISSGVNATYYIWIVPDVNTKTALVRVRGIDRDPGAWDASNGSFEIWELPHIPSYFTGTAVFSNSIKWEWADVINESSYTLKRATDNFTVSTLGQNNTFYIQTGLSVNTSQYIYLEIVNPVGVSATTPVQRYTLSNPPASFAVVQVFASSVTLSWAANSNPPYTRYEISISTDNFSTAFSTPVIDFVGLSTTVFNLANETTYYFRIRSRNEDNIFSDFSSVISTFTLDEAPPPPQDLNINSVNVFITSASVTLSWTPPSAGDIDYYEVHYDSTTPFGDDDKYILTTSLLTFTVTGLSVNTTWYFGVVAVDKPPIVLKSAYSNIVSTYTELKPPQAPALNAIALSTYSIKFFWNDVLNETGYNLISQTNTVVYGTLAGDTTEFIETFLTENSSSSVRGVSAFNSAGASTSSLISAIYTLALSPVDLYVLEVTSYSVKLDWSPTLASSYRIERSADNTNFVFISSALAPPYTDTGLNPLTTYYYRISGVNSNGVFNPQYSAVVSTRTLAPPFSDGVIDVYVNNVEFVRIEISGDKNDIKYTNAAGYASFTALKAGNYTITPYKKGWSFSPDSFTIFLSSRHYEVHFAASYSGSGVLPLPVGSGGSIVEIKKPLEGQLKVITPESMREFKGAINPDKGAAVVVFSPIENPVNKKYTLKIFTLEGMVAGEYEKTPKSEDDLWIELRPANLSPGVYILHIEGPSLKTSKKIVIVR